MQHLFGKAPRDGVVYLTVYRSPIGDLNEDYQGLAEVLEEASHVENFAH